MEEPLGTAVGSGIEAIEARDFLRGDARDPRLADGVVAVAHEMLRVAGVPEAELVTRVDDALASGVAYERFAAMLRAQGAEPDALERIATHPHRSSALALRDGYVGTIDALALGELARELTVADGPFAGIRVRVRIGEAVRPGAPLAEIFGDAVPPERVARAFTVTNALPPARRTVAAVLRNATPTVAAKGAR
jgi:thymidine phosphorylase